MTKCYVFPSVKRICEAFRDLTPETAKLMRALAHGEVNNRHVVFDLGLPSYLNSYPRAGRLMRIFDRLLDMHGVEVFATRKQTYSYCNAGDPYVPTIVYCEGTDTFRLCCQGDIAEREPERDLQDALLNGY